MLQRAVVASLVASLSASIALAEPPDPTLTTDEQQALVTLFEEARDTVTRLITGMTDEQWHFEPAPERWSVGECVEHMARSEAAMIETIRGVVAGDPDPDWYDKTRGKTDLLRRLVLDRRPQGQGGVRAPEEIRPTAGWDRARGIREFYRVHGEARAMIETMDGSIKNRTGQSSLAVMGWLNAYDWMHLLPLHVLRHSLQIEEVKVHPDYPERPATTAAAETDPTLDDQERAALIDDLDRGQETLIDLISGLDDEQWHFRESPDRWSIAECVEHILRGEQVVLDGLRRTPPNSSWHAIAGDKNELVRRTVLDRQRGGAGSPFRSPGEVAPSGGWDRERAIREFYATHGDVRAFVETTTAFKDRIMRNPFPQIGMLNGFDWLTLQALHVLRHSMQIEEVQQAPGYPR